MFGSSIRRCIALKCWLIFFRFHCNLKYSNFLDETNATMKRDNKILRLCVLCVWVRLLHFSLSLCVFCRIINQPLFAIHFADVRMQKNCFKHINFFSQVVKFYDNGGL